MRFSAPFALSIALLLTGCGGTWELRAKCTTAQLCEIEGEIGGTFLVQKSGGTGTVPIDVSSTRISVAGSTVLLQPTGMVTLRALNSTSGVTVGVMSTAWIRVGDEIRFTSPAAVNAWGNSMFGADSLEFQLDPFPAITTPGENAISARLIHAGQVRAGQSTYWNNNCEQFHCIEP